MTSNSEAISQPAHPARRPRGERGGIVLDLGAIEASLREVESHFVNINPFLDSARDRFDALAVDHMMSGYAFVDELIAARINLFSYGNLRLFLELNARVLCGQDHDVRSEAAGHLAATDEHFYDAIDGGIRDVIEWHALHADEPAFKRAAGVYIRILSEPELFIEGNHRTGALVMSGILASAGHPPFVMTLDNAKEFLDWSSYLTTKRKAGLLLRCQMPWLKHRFAAFLQEHADPKFLRSPVAA
ncbi:MAG: hypothetical protein R3D62_02990 [Xanthobacteraceae bacterium]